jgi:hypothetical protein
MSQQKLRNKYVYLPNGLILHNSISRLRCQSNNRKWLLTFNIIIMWVLTIVENIHFLRCYVEKKIKVKEFNTN